MRWWQYLFSGLGWLTFGLVAELFPIACVAHSIRLAGETATLRDVLGYSTILLIAFGLVIATLGDSIIEGFLFRGVSRIYAAIAFVGLPYLGMLTSDAVRADYGRRGAEIIDHGYWWGVEVFVTLGVLAVCALIKLTMMYERNP